MEERLRFLEERVARLEALIVQQSVVQQERTSGTTLQAPLRIINAEGSLLMDIDEQPHSLVLRLFNSQGIAAATLGVDGTHAGWLTLRDADGQIVASLDVESSGARLQLSDHARRGGVVLFGGDSGDDSGGGVHILSTDPAADINISMWSTKSGGQICIRDAQSNEIVLALPPANP